MIINGKDIAEKILDDLKYKINSSSFVPKLVIINASDNDASKIYVNNKIKAADKIGIDTHLENYDKSCTTQDIVNFINLMNHDKSVSGIIVQMPLYKHLNKQDIIDSISSEKDVDGFTAANVGKLYNGAVNDSFVPATALGCLKLINSCVDNLKGMHCVIVGRSNIVGRPLAALLLCHDATVTICHSHTRDLSSITKSADIVISAVGNPRFLDSNYFNKNAVIIDVGISRQNIDGKIRLVGDVDFEDVVSNVKHITPVPKGVGPMTIACLLSNTFDAYIRHNKV